MGRKRAYLLLAILLLGTVGLKVWLGSRSGFDRSLEDPKPRAALIAWLRKHDFDVRGFGESPVLEAYRRSCRLTLVPADPAGFQRTMTAKFAPSHERVYFVYKGRQYDEQPVWRTWIDIQLWRRARDLGITVPRHLIVGVGSTACKEGEIPWSDIAPIY